MYGCALEMNKLLLLLLLPYPRDAKFTLVFRCNLKFHNLCYVVTLLNEPFQMVNVFDQLTVNTEIIKKLVKILIFSLLFA